jgi:predicted lipid-binding transport protein (Tim44 family)
MESATESQAGFSTAAQDQQLAEAQAARPREEMFILLAGFATGLLIGVFFLIYIAVSFAFP